MYPYDGVNALFGASVFVIFLVALAISLYFLPTIISAGRKTQNFIPIFLINLLLGWSLLGWLAALIWSIVDETRMVYAQRLLYQAHMGQVPVPQPPSVPLTPAPVMEPPKHSLFCPQCGASIGPKDQFCGHCGQALRG